MSEESNSEFSLGVSPEGLLRLFGTIRTGLNDVVQTNVEQFEEFLEHGPNHLLSNIQQLAEQESQKFSESLSKLEPDQPTVQSTWNNFRNELQEQVDEFNSFLEQGPVNVNDANSSQATVMRYQELYEQLRNDVDNVTNTILDPDTSSSDLTLERIELLGQQMLSSAA